jgi:choline dehydrogenase-like flavoprotein
MVATPDVRPSGDLLNRIGKTAAQTQATRVDAEVVLLFRRAEEGMRDGRAVGGRRRDPWVEVLEALVVATCPQAVVAQGGAPAVAAEARRFIDVLPGPLRLMLQTCLMARRAGLPLPATAARAVRDLLVTIAYEQPAAHAMLGYDLADWVVRVSRQRSERWATAIRHHDEAVLGADPMIRGVHAPPSVGAGRFVSAPELSGGLLECDAVVIGSGAGGAVVAAELAEAGWSVIVLEEGPHIPTEQFTTDAMRSFRLLYRDGGATAMLGRPPMAYSEGRCVGGSTTVNGGMSWRTPEPILERWRAKHGLRQLRHATTETLFDRVERRLSVAGQDGGSIGRDQQLFRLGAQRLGWQVIDNRRAQVHCAGCNACITGCPTGAKRSTLVSYLPRAVAFGATVVADCKVDRIRFVGKRAVGVRATASDGRPVAVRARAVVVAAGAIQTPALLFRSAVRSPSGELGRNLSVHPGANVIALFNEPVEGWKGVHQAYQLREFASQGVLMAAVNLPPGLVARALQLPEDELHAVMAHYDRIVTAGVLVDDTATGRVRAVGGHAVPSYGLSERDTHRIVEAVGRLCELLFAAGATRIYLPFRGAGPVATVDELRRACARPLPPACVAVSTVHLMGTARMGADPVHSVCDVGGRVHDRVGLYVADASLLPTPLGVNPMETIMMLATLVAQSLIENGRMAA